MMSEVEAEDLPLFDADDRRPIRPDAARMAVVRAARCRPAVCGVAEPLRASFRLDPRRRRSGSSKLRRVGGGVTRLAPHPETSSASAKGSGRVLTRSGYAGGCADLRVWAAAAGNLRSAPARIAPHRFFDDELHGRIEPAYVHQAAASRVNVANLGLDSSADEP
jgi:hypothetical protein